MIISFLLLACGEKEESNPSSTVTDPTTEWDINPQPATEPSEPSEPTIEPSTEPTAAEEFCALFADTCGDFPINMVCEDWYNAAEAGNEGDASGASQACYSYHLDVAAADTSADPANGSYSAHCEHAAGAAPCAAPEPTAAEAFCSLFTDTCGAWGGSATCEDWYNASDVGDASDTSGATQGCYEYHLGVAASDTSADPANGSYSAHCDHAAGLAVCVPTAAEAFCSLFTDTCGAWGGSATCEDWYNASDVGDASDTSGATQGCYEYHLGVAASDTSADPANGSYSAHCDHAAGVAVCVEPQTLEGLTLGATLLDFGSVDLGTGPTELISITNNGPTDVTVTIIHASDPAFDLSPSSPFDVGNTIAVGDTVQLGVEFYPTAAQAYNATMTITSDSTVTPTITFDLTGIGVNPTTTPTYTYTNDISSILSSCMGCHGSSGNFTLNYSNLFNNSSTGMPYITPGDTSQSYLWKKINGTGSGANMSQKPGVNLSTSDFSTIETWITEGAAE